VDDVDGQTPFLMVHWNTFKPTATPVTPVFGRVGVTMLPTKPLTNDQVPVLAAVGVLPAIRPEEELVQMV